MANIQMFSEDIRKLSNDEIINLMYNMTGTTNAIAIILNERGMKKAWNSTTDAFIALSKAHKITIRETNDENQF